MATPAPLSEFLFFRHAIERKRPYGETAFRLLKAPFKSNSSGSVGSWEGNGAHELTHQAPAPNALIVGQFSKQNWMSVRFLGGQQQEILKANLKTARLQFLHLRYAADGQPDLIEVIQKDEALIRLERQKDHPFQLTGVDLKDNWSQIETFDDAVKAIREHYEFESLLKTLTVAESSTHFAVVNEKGRQLKARASTAAHICGPVPVKNRKASEALDDAIENCNVRQIQIAIKDGASLTHGVDSSVSPLLNALFRLEQPGGIECAQALIDAGASVKGLLGQCFGNFIEPSLSLAAAKFLTGNDADVNEADHYGAVPLWEAVSQSNLPAIELLIAEGADPDVNIPLVKSTIAEWVRNRFDETSKRSEKEQFASILSRLTDTQIEVPKPDLLPERFEQENERFRSVLKSQEVLSQLPEAVTVELTKKLKSDTRKKFDGPGQALKSLGFTHQGNYIDDFLMPKAISVYVHTDARLDAVLQDDWWLGTVSCRLLAYGDDAHLFACLDSNFKSPDDPELDCLTELEVPGATPDVLMDRIRQMVNERGVELKENPPEDFPDRFLDGYRRVLAQTKLHFEDRLQAAPIMLDGSLPLFERRRIYLDFSSWDDPSYSSASMAEGLLEDVLNANTDQNFSLEMGVRDAFRLLCLQRLQFAGAPADDAFLDTSCEHAQLLFSNLKTKWKSELTFSSVEVLWESLILCQTAKARGNASHAKTFVSICESVQPRMATKKLRWSADLPLPLGEWAMVFVSSFRKRAIPKLQEWREKVSKSRNERAKRLLKALDALQTGDINSFTENLAASIEEFRKTDPDVGSGRFWKEFAVPETLLWNEAEQQGMNPQLESALKDFLVLP